MNCPYKENKNKYGNLFLLIFFSLPSTQVLAQDKYKFDDSLLKGWGGIGQVSRFNDGGRVESGLYDVELFVNGKFKAREQVGFEKNRQGANVEPCLSKRQLEEVLQTKKTDFVGDSTSSCFFLTDALPGSSHRFEVDRLRLHLAVPHALLQSEPVGYISSSSWDPGETAMFVNYDTSWYQSRYRGALSGKSDYAYAGINAGFNLGLWRLRHQSNYSYSDFGSQSRSKWNNVRTYAQRSLPDWNSELTIGESFTSGQLLGGVRYRGISLSSDERMLAPSQRRYAPEVRGTALTSARVIIRQAGRVVREVNVAPGPFVIDDLFDTVRSGDLEVEVIEADGSSSRFTVPFAAVPESMRPGFSRYSATLGQITQYGKDWFAEGTYQRGISNQLTLNLGGRAANDYLALLGGGVLSGSWGAVGLNATYSNARVELGERKQGWRLGANYSRTFQPTNTTLTLASYRHSTSGFRDVTDVLGVRQALRDGRRWDSYKYQQRNQFTLTLSQNFGSYGSVYFSGSASDYYGGKKKDTQFQFGYTNSWKQFSYSLSWSRHSNRYYPSADDSPSSVPGASSFYRSNQGNVLSLNVSFPLGSSASAPRINAVHSQRSGSRHGNNSQVGMSGVIGDDNTLSYSVAANRDSEFDGMNWSGQIQKQGSLATVNAGYASSHDYRQYHAGLRGALVVHRGGVTFGPYLSETFAVVHADGGEGAKVRYGQGARIDGNGYALVPSLSAYRYNSIQLDPEGLPASTELLETEKRIVPYAGAIIGVSFATRFGQAILIDASLENGRVVPLGASASTAQAPDIGVAGQGGQIYARVADKRGVLTLRWGPGVSDSCSLPYDITNEEAGQDLIRLKGICRVGNDLELARGAEK